MGNGQPLVTIGIPTYNRANKYLRHAIGRSLEQTYKNIEIVVSDNCSKDNTSDLIKSLQEPRLRYFRQETNIGSTNNFNFCLNKSKGEYFLLFHDDDMIDKDFIESCISALKPDQSPGVIITGVRYIDEQDTVYVEKKNNAAGLSPLDFIFGWFKGTTALYLCNTLYNSARLKEVGGFVSRKNLFNDLVPTFTLASQYGRVDVQDVKASFRRHLNNMGSNVPIQDWIEDGLYLRDILCKLFPQESFHLNKRANLYLCRSMYQYISQGQAKTTSPMIDYWRIFKAFEYSSSPLDHLYRVKIKPEIRELLHSLKNSKLSK